MSAPRRTLPDGSELSREKVYRDPSGALCASARIHFRWPRALGGLAAWVAELELQSGARATQVQIRRPIGNGSRVDVRVRLKFPGV